MQSGPQATSRAQPTVTTALPHAMSFFSVCSAAQRQMGSKTMLDRNSKGTAGRHKVRMSWDVGKRLMDMPACAELARQGKTLSQKGLPAPENMGSPGLVDPQGCRDGGGPWWFFRRAGVAWSEE